MLLLLVVVLHRCHDDASTNLHINIVSQCSVAHRRSASDQLKTDINQNGTFTNYSLILMYA